MSYIVFSIILSAWYSNKNILKKKKKRDLGDRGFQSLEEIFGRQEGTVRFFELVDSDSMQDWRA